MSTGDVIGKDGYRQIVSTGRCPVGACANHVYVTGDQYERLQETGETFYCPMGHSQSFTAKPQRDRQKEKLREAEAAAAREREAAERAKTAASRAKRTCPWPTCEGRLLASPRGLRQHMVKAHGAPWATPELSADEVIQVVNGRDPAEVIR